MAFQNQSVSLASGTVKRTTGGALDARKVMTHYRAPTKIKRRLGLGTTSAVVGSGLIYGSAVVPARVPIRPVGPERWPGVGPIISPSYPVPWGGNPSAWSGYAGANQPSSPGNLALTTQQYYSNPASLTPQQWSQLQAAGVIPGTVPYSNSALVSPSGAPSTSGAIDPATGLPYAQELAAAQVSPSSSIIGTDPTTGATTILGIDWYWLAGLAVVAYAFLGKRGR